MDWVQVYTYSGSRASRAKPTKGGALAGGRRVKASETRGDMRTMVYHPDQRLQTIREMWGGARDPFGQDVARGVSPTAPPRSSPPRSTASPTTPSKTRVPTKKEVEKAVRAVVKDEVGVVEHTKKGLRSGIKGFLSRAGKAVEEKVLPRVIELLIGRVMSRLDGAKGKEGKEAVIRGGALMISDAAKRHHMPVKPDALMRALRGSPVDRARLMRRAIQKSRQNRR